MDHCRRHYILRQILFASFVCLGFRELHGGKDMLFLYMVPRIVRSVSIRSSFCLIPSGSCGRQTLVSGVYI